MNIETKKWEVLCSEEQIASRLKELGQQISKDYEGKKLLVVSLLKGSFIFCADLVRNITVPVKIEFMTTSSYGHGEQSSGNVKVVADVNSDLEGYDVLIVDDITDTALTMSHVMNHLKAKNPNSVKSCVLLDKPSRRKVELVPDYCGFEIEDKFVVGYGLNYGDYYRNIPYIFTVTTEEREENIEELPMWVTLVCIY
ncbi:MAG: hypoxanthine phosphoribosyltransferase [Romboutsia sp.]|nr:hypoxanthine phosphoribosyltransferase [Romboutsia sp.]